MSETENYIFKFGQMAGNNWLPYVQSIFDLEAWQHYRIFGAGMGSVPKEPEKLVHRARYK
jgi:hypothetical protein